MPLLSGPNVAVCGRRRPPRRSSAKVPRLVAIGGSEAAKAVKNAGQKLGTEKHSDLFGVVGTGDSPAARLADTVAKAEDLLAQVCRAEKKNPRRARKRFRGALAALDDTFAVDA